MTNNLIKRMPSEYSLQTIWFSVKKMARAERKQQRESKRVRERKSALYYALKYPISFNFDWPLLIISKS